MPTKTCSTTIDTLACPACKGALIWQDLQHQHLFCRYCSLQFPLLKNSLENSTYNSQSYQLAKLKIEDGVLTNCLDNIK